MYNQLIIHTRMQYSLVPLSMRPVDTLLCFLPTHGSFLCVLDATRIASSPKDCSVHRCLDEQILRAFPSLTNIICYSQSLVFIDYPVYASWSPYQQLCSEVLVRG